VKSPHRSEKGIQRADDGQQHGGAKMLIATVANRGFEWEWKVIGGDGHSISVL
jgi:hypothetical protein